MRFSPTSAAKRAGWSGAATWGRAAPAATAWEAKSVALPAGALPLGGMGNHPLADSAVSSELRRRAAEIDAAFEAIEPALRDLAPRQFDADFPSRAQSELRARLGIDMAAEALQANWATPLPMGSVYASCVLKIFGRLVTRAYDRSLTRMVDGEDAGVLIQRWGFHAIDITPCADGRLSGLLDYILRVPHVVVTSRKSYAGAMFEVDESLRHWESVELRRFRDGQPNAAGEPTRFLKIGVYHFSSVDPAHHGCAAHGSDTGRAARTLLTRLEQFAAAVRTTHSAGAEAAILLVGVDTDTDSIRVHVPDAAGAMDIHRYCDSRALYAATHDMARDAAKEAIREAVALCAGVAATDPATEGMRWFCGYLLKNNFSQIEFVRNTSGGTYADAGHTERLIVVGDAIDDVQLRNLVFQAQMNTVEEGSFDLDVGVKILGGLHNPRGLAIPVLAKFRYDGRIPGAREVAACRALRLRRAVLDRHAELAAQGKIFVQAAVRDGEGTTLTEVSPPAATLAPQPEHH